MTNDLTFEQISTVVADIASQATGQKVASPINGNQFVTVATTALKTGYDPFINAVSQTLTDTIFSIRPYEEKLKMLRADAKRYGNHTRKINALEMPFEDDKRYSLKDGVAIDQYKVTKPKAIQTNFYGGTTLSKSLTIPKDQMDNCVTGPGQFEGFLGMIMQNGSNQINQNFENLSRSCLLNLVTGVINKIPDNNVKLLTLYNKRNGTELTPEQVRQAANWGDFSKFAIGVMSTYSDRMTERSALYHQNLTAGAIMRQTPYRNQRMFLLSTELNQIKTQVLSSVFNEQFLKLGQYEVLNFWQSLKDPENIKFTPSYMDKDGTIKTGTQVTSSAVFGVLFDEEAAGHTILRHWSATSPFNAAGGYTNIFWHWDDRWWNDFTENCVVFTID